jgi:hypothetical protein
MPVIALSDKRSMKIRRIQKQRCKHPIQSLNRSDPGFHTTECRGLQNILFNQTISAAFNQVKASADG